LNVRAPVGRSLNKEAADSLALAREHQPLEQVPAENTIPAARRRRD